MQNSQHTLVFEKIEENIKLLYRKAIDADQALDNLRLQGQAKHSSIFSADAGFTAKSNRFAPYVAEVTENLESLRETSTPSEDDLALLVRKLEQLFRTLSHLQTTLK